MILNAAYRAMLRLMTPPFRSILWKSLGVCIVILVVLWVAIKQIFVVYIWPMAEAMLPSMAHWMGWIGFTAAIVFNLGLTFMMAFLIAPITALIGGFFMDDVAKIIEQEDYPNDKPGVEMPLGRATTLSLNFVGLSIIGNLAALLLFFIPGINLIAFFAINAYLLGREYFEFAAHRFHSELETKAFYRQNNGTVFLAGLVIAIFVSIPIINLVTPLFAAALMTHVHKALSLRQNYVDHKKTP